MTKPLQATAASPRSPTRLNPRWARDPGGEERSAPACAESQSSESVQEFLQSGRGLLAPALAHRQSRVALAVAPDDHEGDLLELGLANSLAHRLLTLVDLRTVARLPDALRHAGRV